MTKMIAVTLLAVSLAAVSASQLILKYALSRQEWPLIDGDQWTAAAWRLVSSPTIWVGASLVLVGVICWYLAMVRLPLTLMLPMAGSIAPVVSIGAYVFLGESLTPYKIAAIVLIAAGVSWLAWLNS